MALSPVVTDVFHNKLTRLSLDLYTTINQTNYPSERDLSIVRGVTLSNTVDKMSEAALAKIQKDVSEVQNLFTLFIRKSSLKNLFFVL